MESQLSDSLKPTVLILDDDSNLCMMLDDILQEYHFNTIVTETPEAAVKSTKELHPNLALVDFKLGTVTGIEVAHELKKIDEDLPVILMTAYPTLDLAVKAIQSDIYDFISKPVDTTYLLRSLNKALEKRTLSEENKKLILSLQESNTELERMNRMKSKFLSIVTHDLRTPLTSIQGYTELLKTETKLSKTDRENSLTAIEKSSERMNYLIGNLMDMVSFEAGKLRVELVDMDFLKVFQELKSTLAPLANNRKVNLEWIFPENPILILGDFNRLIQVATNLISNAVKHTPENGKITVRVSIKEGNIEKMVLTEITDTGEGIAPENQPRVFEQFYQVETSPTRRMGLGLGLSIAQEIVHIHKGEIGVFSEGLGKGSTFYFTLPLK